VLIITVDVIHPSFVLTPHVTPHTFTCRDVTTQLAQIWAAELPRDASGAIVIDNVTDWIKRWVTIPATGGRGVGRRANFGKLEFWQ
jgi:hypothetical protein